MNYKLTEYDKEMLADIEDVMKNEEQGARVAFALSFMRGLITKLTGPHTVAVGCCREHFPDLPNTETSDE